MRQGGITYIVDTKLDSCLAVAQCHKQVRSTEDKNAQINWQYIVEYMLNNIHINTESAYQIGREGAVVKFERSRKRDFLCPFN